ncbi:MAG: 3-phosphoshikimate 1-carboxyvinyltransferase, partial [Gammaproteobacteria bacterium]
MQSLAGELDVPADKSISHRALLLGAVADEPVTIDGALDGEDCFATRRALEALGAKAEIDESGFLLFKGEGAGSLASPGVPLDLGNSGTGIRLLCGLIAGLGLDAELSGDASLQRRPMDRIAMPLSRMGASISTRDGKPPVVIKSGHLLTGIDYTMPVASAQVKTAILLAAIWADGTTRVRQPGICRDHTERMLQSLGAPIRFDRNVAEIVGPTRLKGGHISVPGDFSSAAFFIVAGLLAADDRLVIRNVGVNPTRTGLIDILRKMGARIEVGDVHMRGVEPVADITVYRSDLTGIVIPGEHVATAIDEFPVLFVAAAAAKGETRLDGAAELRHKESDRIAAMADCLDELGIQVTTTSDGMRVTGGTLHGGTVESRGDHRIAMAMAVAGTVAEGPVTVKDIANVATSFPGFRDTAAGIGFDILELEIP